MLRNAKNQPIETVIPVAFLLKKTAPAQSQAA
jgi:hypothetical protein